MTESHHKTNSSEPTANSHGSVKAYTIGFILSLVLTFAAYITTLLHQQSLHELFPHEFMVPFVLFLAFLQLLVQLIFFLHLGQEKKPRWNLWFFLLTAGTILTVIIGALWIMNHLEYNHTKPEAVEEFILHDEGLDVEKQPQHNMHSM